MGPACFCCALQDGNCVVCIRDGSGGGGNVVNCQHGGGKGWDEQ